jgi:hypothetical protein
MCVYCVPEAGLDYNRSARPVVGNLRRRSPFALFAFRDFLAIDSDIAGCLDADANLRTVHRHHGHFDIIADAQTFTGAARQYQHEKTPPV